MATEFCISTLRRVLGFDQVEEIAANILSLPTRSQIQHEVFSLLGQTVEVEMFLFQLFDLMKLPPENQQRTSTEPKQKKNRKKKAPTTSDPSIHDVPFDQLVQIEKSHSSQEQPTSSQRTSSSYRPKQAPSIHTALSESFVRERVFCECQARRHPLVSNCTHCGRVVCAREGAGECMTCHTNVDILPEQRNVVSEWEKEFYKSPGKEEEENTQNQPQNPWKRKSEELTLDQYIEHQNEQSGRRIGREIGESRDTIGESAQSADLEKALAYRDRLLKYDAEHTERSKVIDDEADFFEYEHNIWSKKSASTTDTGGNRPHRRRNEREDSRFKFDRNGKLIFQPSQKTVDESVLEVPVSGDAPIIHSMINTLSSKLTNSRNHQSLPVPNIIQRVQDDILEGDGEG